MFSPPPRKSVGFGPAVLVEARPQRPATTADVQRERHRRVLQTRPHAVEVGMRRRVRAGRVRRHEDRAAAEPERLLDRSRPPLRILQRHETDRDEPVVVGAELAPSRGCGHGCRRRAARGRRRGTASARTSRTRAACRSRAGRARCCARRGSNAPYALQPLRVISPASMSSSCDLAAPCDGRRRAPRRRPARPRRRGSSGRMRSRMPGSAYSTSQSLVSMRWLSAS